MERICMPNVVKEFETDNSDGYWVVGACFLPNDYDGYSQVNEWVFDNEEDAKEKFTFIAEYWKEPSLDEHDNQYAWIHPLGVLRNPNNPKQTELELNNG